VSGRAVGAFGAVGLVAGVALALAVTAATDEVYEATALLETVAPEPGAPEAEEAQAAAASQRLLVAAPASADDDPIRPRRVLNLVGGVLLGLVAGLGSCLLYRRRPAPAAAEAAPSVRAAAG
jgi:uncharacterized protein involved in exopolysaccharide biosynthesis